MKIIKLDKKAISEATDFLNKGGVVIFPTDTIYGFLALAENKKSVKNIFKIKKRPRSKPFAIFIKDFKMAKELAEISEKQLKILKNKWPGKYTFVLTSLRGAKATKQSKTIALRIPKYKPLNDLLKKINKPLVQTSVNISGQDALMKIEDIKNRFAKQKILLIDGGNLKRSKPSKVIDLTAEKIKVLRK